MARNPQKQQALSASPLPEQGVPPNILQEHLRKIATEHVDAGNSHLYIVDVDQELATRLLMQTPPTQRKLSPETSAAYAKDMKAGKWRADLCEPLQFDANLQLVNGQHRLDAVRKSPGFILKGAFLVVLKTVDETLALPIDIVRHRFRRDYERGLGISLNACITSGLLREHLGFKPGHLAGNVVDQAQIVAAHPWRAIAGNIPRIGKFSAGVTAGVARVLRHAKDPDEVVQFFTAVLANDQQFRGEYSGNVRFAANWLTTQAKGKSDSCFQETAWRMIKAWNDHKNKRDPKIFPRYSVGDLTADIFVHP